MSDSKQETWGEMRYHLESITGLIGREYAEVRVHAQVVLNELAALEADAQSLRTENAGLHDELHAQARNFEALRARNEALEGDMRFLLSFVPPWAKDVPEGLDPTFYGTGTAEGDRGIKARVDAIRAALAQDANGREK